ncbi:MAG: DUF2284 domain-containing protein [Dehalococcoidia bacterium]
MTRVQQTRDTSTNNRLANARLEFDVDADLAHLVDVAIGHGASKATVVSAEQVVIDERVTMKCKLPPCEWYGRSLMCPPYSPKASEFREYLERYHHGILVQVECPIQDELKALVEAKDETYAQLHKKSDFIEAKRKSVNPSWHKLHGVAMGLEREAIKLGYYLSAGLVAGSCRLCDECDVSAPCKRPYEARPSMEACGIDVVGTSRNAGWHLPFPARTDKIFLTGLVMIV